MNMKLRISKEATDKLIISIQHRNPKYYSTEEKIRIVLAAPRGEESIAGLCSCQGV